MKYAASPPLPRWATLCRPSVTSEKAKTLLTLNLNSEVENRNDHGEGQFHAAFQRALGVLSRLGTCLRFPKMTGRPRARQCRAPTTLSSGFQKRSDSSPAGAGSE